MGVEAWLIEMTCQPCMWACSDWREAQAVILWLPAERVRARGCNAREETGISERPNAFYCGLLLMPCIMCLQWCSACLREICSGAERRGWEEAEKLINTILRKAHAKIWWKTKDMASGVKAKGVAMLHQRVAAAYGSRLKENNEACKIFPEERGCIEERNIIWLKKSRKMSTNEAEVGWNNGNINQRNMAGIDIMAQPIISQMAASCNLQWLCDPVWCLCNARLTVPVELSQGWCCTLTSYSSCEALWGLLYSCQWLCRGYIPEGGIDLYVSKCNKCEGWNYEKAPY